MGTLKKDILVGFLVGVLVTFSGTFFYLKYFTYYQINNFFSLFKEGRLSGKIVAVAAIPNILIFFIFLNKNQDSRAKGVLMAVIFVALVTLILKII